MTKVSRSTPANTSASDVERLQNALVQMAADMGTTLDLLTPPPGYAHLPLAIIDSVYSLRSPYSTARTAVSAYRERSGVTDRGTADSRRGADFVEHTIDDFLSAVDGYNGEELARLWFGGALYKAPGTDALKADVCVAAARALRAAGVNARDDLDDGPHFAKAKSSWKSVHGLGQQSWSYFTMLVGIEDWKVDTWVGRFVADAVGRDVDPREGRRLLDATVGRLDAERQMSLSRRAIDHAIWRTASGRPPR